MFWRMAIDIRREFGLIPKRLFLWCVLAAFALIGTLFFIHMREAFSEGRSILVAITQTMESFPLAFLMTPLRFLASLLVMRVDAGAPSAWVSVLFWLVFTGSGYRAVRSQRRYLYEYASRLADERREFMARMRDPVRSLKRRRRQEAVEVRTPWFLRSFHPRRARAILWRDLIIAWRSYGGVLTALSILFVIGAVAWWVGVWWFHAPLVGGRSWAVMVVMMALAALPLTLVSPVAMADLLRHAETQKPLPIGALETVAMHVLQWTLLINAITFAPSVLALILLPPVRHIVLTVLLLGWSFTHLFLSGTFWISLFNPDQDDPIQRMYGGLFSVLMMVVLSIPGGIVLGVSSFLHVPLAVRVPVALAVNGGVAWGVHLLAARKYERFVFTE